MTPAPPLPEVPAGHECPDLIWSLLVPAADAYLPVLPPDADPRWASGVGIRFLWAEGYAELQGRFPGVVFGAN